MSVSPVLSINFVKCPPYCRVNCIIKHHPLLVALLNATDSDDMVISKGKLQDLDHVVKKYLESGWHLVDDIPETVENFRYSLLHWASSMGRISATYWLLSKGVPSTLKSNDVEQETPLHRALLCLQETCPTTSVDRFQSLLLPLEECLSQQNAHGNTPLHLCAEMLVNEMPRFDFYNECFGNMLSYAIDSKGRIDYKRMINIKNSDGDTVVHILVTSGKQLPCIKRLVGLGADVFAFNKKGKHPMDIAINCGYVRTSKYLEQQMLEISKLDGRQFNATTTDNSTPGHKRSATETLEGEPHAKIDASGIIAVEMHHQQSDQSQMDQSPGPSNLAICSQTPSFVIEAQDTTPNTTSKPKEYVGPAFSSTQVHLNSEEKEMFIRNTGYAKRIQLNTDRLLDKGRGPIRGMATLNAPGGDKKMIKFLTGCSNISRKIFRNAIDADRDILEERSSYLQTMVDEVQTDIYSNCDKQKEKVEGIQKLLDNLKNLQKEERQLDVEIKHMMVQLNQTVQATDGLKERLTHCSLALNVLDSLGEDDAAAESSTTQSTTSIAGTTSTIAASSTETVEAETATVQIPGSSEDADSLIPITMDISKIKRGMLSPEDMEEDESVYDAEEPDIHALKTKMLSKTISSDVIPPPDTNTESPLTNEQTESSQDFSEPEDV